MAEINTNETLEQYLTFRLAEENYAIDVSQVREILDKTSITKVPRTPNYMLGVINLRGSVVPVINMRSKFDLGEAEVTRDTCIIVIEIKIQGELLVIGVQADSVLEVVDLLESQIEAPPSIGTSLDIEFIRGMGKHNDNFLIILDIDRIFSTAELTQLTTEAQSEK